MKCGDCGIGPAGRHLAPKITPHHKGYDRCEMCIDKYLAANSRTLDSYHVTDTPEEGMECYNCQSTIVLYTMTHKNNTSSYWVCQRCYDEHHVDLERNNFSYIPIAGTPPQTGQVPMCTATDHQDRVATQMVTIVNQTTNEKKTHPYCDECAKLLMAAQPSILGAKTVLTELIYPGGNAPTPPPPPPPTLEEQLDEAIKAHAQPPVSTPQIAQTTQNVHTQIAQIKAEAADELAALNLRIEPVAPTSNIATTASAALNGDIVEAKVVSNDTLKPLIVFEVPIPGEDEPRMLASTVFDKDIKPGQRAHVELLIPQPRIRIGRFDHPENLPLTKLRPAIAPPVIQDTSPKIHLPGSPGEHKQIPAIVIHQQDPNLPLGVRYVKRPADYYLTDEVRDEIHSWELMSLGGVYVKVRVIGDTGVGKTELGYVFASEYERPFIKVETGNFESPEEWFGMRRIESDGQGGVRDYFQATALTRALMVPRCTILLDEGNRTHARNSNGIMGVFDDTRSAWIDAIQEWVTADPSVVIIMTLNIGGQYHGTHHLDAAMQTRFPHVLQLKWLPELEEAKILVWRTGISTKSASDLVMIANKIRERCTVDATVPLDGIVSTRTLIACANKIALGKRPPMEAMRTTILPIFADEGGNSSHRAQVLQIIQSQFRSGDAK